MALTALLPEGGSPSRGRAGAMEAPTFLQGQPRAGQFGAGRSDGVSGWETRWTPDWR